MRPLSLLLRKPRLRSSGAEIENFSCRAALPILILFLVLISGCAAGPAPVRPVPYMIPDDYPVYFSILTDGNEELISRLTENMLSSDRTEDIIGRTSRVFGGFSVGGLWSDGRSGVFSIAALGEYPVCFMKLSLSLNKDFKKHKINGSFWSNEAGFQIGFSDSNFVFLSNGDMERMLSIADRIEPEDERGISAPLVEILESGDLAFSGKGILPFDGVSKLVNEKVVDSWSLVMNRDDEYYKGILALEFKDERSARVITATLRLLGMSGGLSGESSEDAVDFISGEISRDRRTVKLSGIVFTSSGMIELLENYLR